MNRREFVQKSVALPSALMVPKAGPKGAPKSRPNLLYVFSDEHRASSLPGEPFCDAIAPNLDAFRRQNLSMDACLSSYPLCSPHRGILISGRWPSQTGITANNPVNNIKTTEISLGETFRRNGYHTGYIGKWHLSGPGEEQTFIPKGPHRMGFEDWNVWGLTNNHYKGSVTFDQDTGEKKMPEGYNATLMTDQAVDFLKKQPKDKPWMLMVSWNPPHPPFDGPEAERALYAPEKLKFPPNAVLTPRMRHAQQGYEAHITAIDLEFARLLKTLEETGQADNTIVVYTSDHGEMMGSQNQMHKMLPWEESARVPFFIRYPGVTPARTASPVLFSTIDIYPTMCGLAGIPVPPHCGGKDLSAAMRGRAIDPPESVFLMSMFVVKQDPGDPYKGRPIWRAVRTPTHTYAVAEQGRWFLYDNVNDPYQMKNLIADPAQASLIAKLDVMLAEWLKAASDPFPLQEAISRGIFTFPSSPAVLSSGKVA